MWGTAIDASPALDVEMQLSYTTSILKRNKLSNAP